MFVARNTGLGDLPRFTTIKETVAGGVYTIPPAVNVAAQLQYGEQQRAQHAAQAAAAAGQPVIAVPDTIFGLPKLLVFGVGGAAALFVVFKMLKSSPATSAPLPVHQNPDRRHRRRNPERVSRADRLKRAVDAYESFHWGDKPSKLVAKKVSKPPKVGVKLGKLVSVAYETHKNGEHAVWEHEFGEEGGKRPDLVMDADNKRLHIVGGSYDVRPEGIID